MNLNNDEISREIESIQVDYEKYLSKQAKDYSEIEDIDHLDYEFE